MRKKRMVPLTLFSLLLALVPALVRADEPVRAFVAASGGLHLRSGPSQADTSLALIPYGTAITVTGAPSRPLTVDGIADSWVPVKYREMEGFVFGGYLISVPPPATGCHSLGDYWKSTSGTSSMRTYYTVEETGEDRRPGDGLEYTQAPPYDDAKQALVLHRKASRSDGSTYESMAVDGAGSETLRLQGITVREAFLILRSCLPDGARPVPAFAELQQGHQVCTGTMDATYRYRIVSGSGFTSVEQFGSIGGMDCMHAAK